MQEWSWSERFASQPELQAYFSHVAERYDLRRFYKFSTQLTSARWDEDKSVWVVQTNTGDTYRTVVLYSGAGYLSAAKEPEIAGTDEFKGELHRTSHWPAQGVDLAGLRVGVIGTGSTGVQLISTIAAEVGSLTVFQRTPNYATPLGNGPMDPEFDRMIKAEYGSIITRMRSKPVGAPYDSVEPSALAVSEQERQRTFERKMKAGGFRLAFDAYEDINLSPEANELAAEFIREKIRGRVDDPEVAEKMIPRDHPYGTKRPPLETNYYEVYNPDNVSLVDI